MNTGHVVIVGAGIIGLTHALQALEAGWKVTVMDRSDQALGASVRNFGSVWPIGCMPGEEREQALYGAKRWKEVAAEEGFWLKPQGSLSLAYREEAWEVLQEFAGLSKAGEGFRLLKSHEILSSCPAVNPESLRGALFSEAETSVHPRSAIDALTQRAIRKGARVEFKTSVIKVLEDAVETSDGRLVKFDQLVIAAGEEMRLLFPCEIAATPVQKCRLQMMRTVPQPSGFQLGAILVSDLTLCHYPAFQKCPSATALRERLEKEVPECRAKGVHIMAAQHPDGSIVVGDSHEYGMDFPPDSSDEVDELILREFRKFVALPTPRIASRWQGIYLKSTVGQTQVVLPPRERVTLVTAMGGLGMTLSWGLARKTVAGWQ